MRKLCKTLGLLQTNAIGCGYVVWEDEHNPEFPQGLKYHEVVVCNYCPGGNVAGKPGR